MPTFKLAFHPAAVREWRKLDSSTKTQFEKKLRERLAHPRVLAARLRELQDCYKIKLRKSGFRLIYRVEDERIVVTVIAVGKRDKGEAYEKSARRIA